MRKVNQSERNAILAHHAVITHSESKNVCRYSSPATVMSCCC